MPYTSATNTKILEFLNRAQTRIGLTSIIVADRVSEGSQYQTYKNEAEIAYELLSFVRSLDNIFNDWTEAEIVEYIDKWTAKANLNLVPYYEHEDFNLNITFEATEAPSADLTQVNADLATKWSLVSGGTPSGLNVLSIGNIIGSGIGIHFSASTTDASGDSQTVFGVTLAGANATSAQTTYAVKFVNQKTGTTSENVASYHSASGGETLNNAVYGIATGGVTALAGDFVAVSGSTDNYALRASATGTGTNNYGLHVTSSGGTNNYAIYIANGTLCFANAPTNDDALTQVLVRDGSTGVVKYRSAASLGASGMANPMTTIGDLIYSTDGSGTPGRIGIGGASTVLTVVGGIPTWQTPSGIISGLTAGKIPKASSSTALSNSIMTESGTDIAIAGSLTATGGIRTDSGAYIKKEVISIGDWNMAVNSFVDVSLGGINYKKIRTISVIIRDDSDTDYDTLNIEDATGINVGGTATILTTGDIRLNRWPFPGVYDSADYNATSFNRGYMTIEYEV